jgi:hypothetical protein
VDVSAPPPGAPGPFSLADADAIEQAMRQAGFTDVGSDHLHVSFEIPCTEAYVSFLQDDAAPISAMLAASPLTCVSRSGMLSLVPLGSTPQWKARYGWRTTLSAYPAGASAAYRTRVGRPRLAWNCTSSQVGEVRGMRGAPISAIGASLPGETLRQPGSSPLNFPRVPLGQVRRASRCSTREIRRYGNDIAVVWPGPSIVHFSGELAT